MVQSQPRSLPSGHGSKETRSRDGALRQAILAGAGAFVMAGSTAQMVQAASCAANATSVVTTCTGPLTWNANGGSLTNSGTISSGSQGVILTGGALTSLTNNGTISTTGTGVSANVGNIGTVTNTGLITSPSGIGIAIFPGRKIDTIINSGTIFGGVTNVSANNLTIVGACQVATPPWR
jgi:hypothetical protein